MLNIVYFSAFISCCSEYFHTKENVSESFRGMCDTILSKDEITYDFT